LIHPSKRKNMCLAQEHALLTNLEHSCRFAKPIFVVGFNTINTCGFARIAMLQQVDASRWTSVRHRLSSQGNKQHFGVTTAPAPEVEIGS
jgi:hypothetical protein